MSDILRDVSAVTKLREGIDYTLDENGLLVFTAAYHLARGTCCGSGCRNCPYGHANVPKAEADEE